MALYFEGTSTGNRYEVGKTYEMNGREYTAQPDGSFVREGTRTGFTTDSGSIVRENDGGHSLVGSSRDPSVRWFASGSDSLVSGRYSPGSGVSLAGGSSRSGDPDAVFRAANGMVQVRAPLADARYRAAAVDYVRTAAWSGKDEPPQDNLFFGAHIRANPRSTNAELFEARYGDFGSSIIGLGVLADDMWYTGSAYLSDPRTHKAAAQGARNAGEAAIGALMSGWDNLRAWGATEQAKEQREAEIAKELYDAYGLRDALQAAEAAKVETPRRSQAILGGMGVFGGL